MKQLTLGQIGYEAYCEWTGNKSLISGAELPKFEDLKTPIQEAWEHAGQAVAASLGHADAITGQVSPKGEQGTTTVVK